MLQDKKIGFIGAGKMCEAILSGIIKAEIVSNNNVSVTDISMDRLNILQEKYKVNTINNKDNTGLKQIIDICDIIILAIKPQMAQKVLEPLKNNYKDKMIISIMGGVTVSRIKELTNSKKIIRVMPNTPMLIGEGVAGICNNEEISKENFDLAIKIFECVGIVYKLDEKLIDALTGVSGCGPAFAYMFIDALADAGVMQGLSRQMAIEMAAKMLVGSAKMVLELGEHPDKLKDDVCSPAGGTIAGVYALEKGAFRATVIDAVEKSCTRMKEVGKNS